MNIQNRNIKVPSPVNVSLTLDTTVTFGKTEYWEKTMRNQENKYWKLKIRQREETLNQNRGWDVAHELLKILQSCCPQLIPGEASSEMSSFYQY